MHIRDFVLDDYEAAADLWEAAQDMSAPPLGEVYRKLERDPELFLVAEDENDLVGVVMGAYDGRRGWIFRLAVDPTRRRQHIASALVEELEDRFRGMGVSKIRLLVYTENEGGREFWKHSGYEEFDGIVLATKDLDGDAGGDPC